MATGGQNLGGAQFTVTANTAQFTQGLQQAQAQAQQTAGVIQGTLTHSSRGAAQGLLALSQAVDDAQYGFRAIVNNIPQIVYMMGGSAGIAGAVGIAAVAINQLLAHMDLFIGTSPELDAMNARAKEGADAFEEMAKALGDVATAAGTAFKETATNIPGGASGLANSIAGAMVEGGNIPAPAEGPDEGWKAMLALTPKKSERVMTKAKELAGRAAKGDPAALADLRRLAEEHPDAFTDEQRAAIERNPEAEQQKRLELQGGRNARKIEEQQADKAVKEKEDQTKLEIEGRKNARAIEKQMAEDAHRKRLEALEDQRQTVLDQRRDVQEQFKNRGGGQILQGAKAALDLYQTSGSGEKEKIELMKASDKKLREIADAVKAERRVRPGK